MLPANRLSVRHVRCFGPGQSLLYGCRFYHCDLVSGASSIGHMDDASATSNSGEVPARRLRRSAFSVDLGSFGVGDELSFLLWTATALNSAELLLTLVDLTAASSATTSSGGVRVPNFLRRTANFCPATPLRTTLQHRLALVCRSLYFFSIISITFCFTSLSPGAFGPTFSLTLFRGLTCYLSFLLLLLRCCVLLVSYWLYFFSLTCLYGYTYVYVLLSSQYMCTCAT